MARGSFETMSYRRAHAGAPFPGSVRVGRDVRLGRPSAQSPASGGVVVCASGFRSAARASALRRANARSIEAPGRLTAVVRGRTSVGVVAGLAARGRHRARRRPMQQPAVRPPPPPRVRERVMSVRARTAARRFVLAALLALGAGEARAAVVCSDTPGPNDRIYCARAVFTNIDIGIDLTNRAIATSGDDQLGVYAYQRGSGAISIGMTGGSIATTGERSSSISGYINQSANGGGDRYRHDAGLRQYVGLAQPRHLWRSHRHGQNRHRHDERIDLHDGRARPRHRRLSQGRRRSRHRHEGRLRHGDRRKGRRRLRHSYGHGRNRHRRDGRLHRDEGRKIPRYHRVDP